MLIRAVTFIANNGIMQLNSSNIIGKEMKTRRKYILKPNHCAFNI